MSTNYSQRQIQVEFTHEGFVMGKIFDFLLMISESWAKNSQKIPMSMASCIENRQNLYMTTPTCKGKRTFLYISKEVVTSYIHSSFIAHHS